MRPSATPSIWNATIRLPLNSVVPVVVDGAASLGTLTPGRGFGSWLLPGACGLFHARHQVVCRGRGWVDLQRGPGSHRQASYHEQLLAFGEPRSRNHARPECQAQRSETRCSAATPHRLRQHHGTSGRACRSLSFSLAGLRIPGASPGDSGPSVCAGSSCHQNWPVTGRKSASKLAKQGIGHRSLLQSALDGAALLPKSPPWQALCPFATMSRRA